MANKTSNYPAAQASRADPAVISDMLSWLDFLRQGEKPKNNAELRERIEWYFSECQKRGKKPTVETLCLCLHMTRQAAWKARQRGDERAQILQDAWQTLVAVTESFLTDGTVNPISAMFLLKSQHGYRDTLTIEQADSRETLEATMPSKEDIIKRLPSRTIYDEEPEIDL